MNESLHKEKINYWLDHKISIGIIGNWEQDEIRLVSEIAYLLTLHNVTDEAIIIFEGLVTIAPNISYFYETLGALYLRQGKFSQAIKNFEVALENQTSIISLVNRGECYLLNNESSKAKEDFKKALWLASENKNEQNKIEKETEIAIRRAYLLLSKMKK